MRFNNLINLYIMKDKVPFKLSPRNLELSQDAVKDKHMHGHRFLPP